MRATRRSFCLAAASAAAGWLAACGRRTSSAAVAQVGGDVTIAEFTAEGRPAGTVVVAKIVKTETEWRDQLSTWAFDVTRHAGTEPSFSGQYWNLHDAGLYRCICCDTALFSSDTKFESGTGWPSFWAPLAPENVFETADWTFGMSRTAVACRRCDAHLGHVFDDGPPPTGRRYCMNSVALKFVKFA